MPMQLNQSRPQWAALSGKLLGHGYLERLHEYVTTTSKSDSQFADADVRSRESNSFYCTIACGGHSSFLYRADPMPAPVGRAVGEAGTGSTVPVVIRNYDAVYEPNSQDCMSRFLPPYGGPVGFWDPKVTKVDF